MSHFSIATLPEGSILVEICWNITVLHGNGLNSIMMLMTSDDKLSRPQDMEELPPPAPMEPATQFKPGTHSPGKDGRNSGWQNLLGLLHNRHLKPGCHHTKCPQFNTGQSFCCLILYKEGFCHRSSYDGLLWWFHVSLYPRCLMVMVLCCCDSKISVILSDFHGQG